MQIINIYPQVLYTMAKCIEFIANIQYDSYFPFSYHFSFTRWYNIPLQANNTEKLGKKSKQPLVGNMMLSSSSKDNL
jgi:hypothetical protein